MPCPPLHDMAAAALAYSILSRHMSLFFLSPFSVVLCGGHNSTMHLAWTTTLQQIPNAASTQATKVGAQSACASLNKKQAPKPN
eukprot:1158032-Pelagomonas_calceolata.AAC.12